GHPFISSPLDRLPAAVQGLALQASGLREFPHDLAQLRYTLRRESEEGADHLKVWVLGPDGRPIGHSSDLISTEAPRREAGVPVLRYATDPRRKPADPDLQSEGEVLDEAGQPLPVTAGL